MPQQLDFAQLGSLFNAVTDEITGGVSPINKELLLHQISTAQQGLNTLANNGTFTDGATITHVQNMADQMNFLTNQIGQFGTNSFAPKFLNDVVRDIQDIAQGDPNLAGLVAANHGFQQTSNLLTPPVPFMDSAAQDAFIVQFGHDSSSLAARATALAGTDPNSAAVHTLVTDLQTFSANASAFSTAQGGLYSARFNNEFTNVTQGVSGGVQGTAVNELVHGLQNGNAALVTGAATVLAANAMDVQGNNQFAGLDIGTGLPVPAPLTPPAADSVHNGGLFFNDAATKLVGGVYAGNQASIVSDLKNAALGVQADITAQPLTGQALTDAQHVVALLGHEATSVGNITVGPTPVTVQNTVIGVEQAAILHIVNHDATLTGLANGGFTPNPPVTSPIHGQGQDLVASIGDMTNMHATIDFSHMWHHA